ncbi:MAG: hydroxyethylthiazole kinase [Pseudodesulfovibrio sp.]|nr:hydroxyethylthiazole kinase [Pseudodesulfovibrio sp.]
MPDIETFWRDLNLIRTINPLVLNITNYVVTNNTANALLAISASPIMSFAKDEVEELVGLSAALVINVGTLNAGDIEVMAAAWAAANAKGIPVVFDPVGAGASRLRTDTSLSMLGKYSPSVIRGNASEIMTLAGEAGQSKGVDSSQSAGSAAGIAQALALVNSCVVCVSGEEDMVTDGNEGYRVCGGHEIMPRITGLGCTASAICAAFAAVNKNCLEATVHGMIAMAIAGALAAKKSDGPGSFQMHLYDALYSLTETDVERFMEIYPL